MVHVKICGLSRPRDIAAAREADAVGFVVASPKSHRNVSFEAARDLARLAAPFQTTVAVTAEIERAVLEDILENVRPQALQIPFRTPNGTLEDVRDRFPDARLFMAVRPEDAHMTPEHLVDAFFLDALAADRYGGTGTLTDWNRASVVIRSLKKPVILAGGLRAANVGEGVRTVQPYGVDVSTGVEGDDRLKDPSRIRAFIAAARAATTEEDGKPDD